MSHYRAYYLRHDHIVAPESFEAADDAQAMLRANEMLSTTRFPAIELWQGSRMVGALSASTPSSDDAAESGSSPQLARFQMVKGGI